MGVAFTSDGATAYVANFGAGTVSVIDTATRTVSATVGVGDFPFGVAVAPGGAPPADTALSCTRGTNRRGIPVDICRITDTDGIRTVHIRNTATNQQQTALEFVCSDAPGSVGFTVPAGTKYKVSVTDCDTPRNKTTFVIRAQGDVNEV